MLSVDLDEQALIDGLVSIGLDPNIILIKSYFGERDQFRNSEQFNRLNIPEYLIHLAKDNCDFKRIIELVRCACLDHTISAHFYPFDEDMRPVEKTVKVMVKEILKRWTRNTNLMEISKIKNKNFNKLNILGL